MKLVQIIKFIGLALALILLFSLALMLLWNWLVPAIFDGPEINLPQAVGLLALAKILLGFGHSGWGGGRNRERKNWKNKLRSKWEQMTPEEKEKFRHGFVAPCHRRKTEDKLETA